MIYYICIGVGGFGMGWLLRSSAFDLGKECANPDHPQSCNAYEDEM